MGKDLDMDDPRKYYLDIFNSVRSHVDGSALEFIESLYEFWITIGFLTKKQENALMKFYDNVKH